MPEEITIDLKMVAGGESLEALIRRIVREEVAAHSKNLAQTIYNGIPQRLAEYTRRGM